MKIDLSRVILGSLAISADVTGRGVEDSKIAECPLRSWFVDPIFESVCVKDSCIHELWNASDE